MLVTLTRDQGPHKKGSTHQVTPAVAARLIRKGVAVEAKQQQVIHDDDLEDSSED